MPDIRKWLKSLDFEQYADAFERNAIGSDILGELTDEDLRTLGVQALGHRKRILKAADELGQAQSATTSTLQRDGQTSLVAGRGAERRQLTVMLCDLVDSTALSQRLDPEDLREINRTYQDVAKRAIETFDGFVARYMGDGVLAYFGYPNAHEDDAERAVHAGLEIVNALKDVNSLVPSGVGMDLKVRVGIATGPVVVGDLVGEGASQESAVVGQTPNLAARLQGLAEPNTIVVAERTRKLLGTKFKAKGLGPRPLRGLDTPVACWQIEREDVSKSRFEAAHEPKLTPLVGREEELDLLLRRWEQAKAGDGQLVLVSGEPGIGKSRLTRALSEHLTGQPHAKAVLQSSFHHSNSAFFPFVAELQTATRLSTSDSQELKLQKLELALRGVSDDLTRDVPLLAALFSVPGGQRDPVMRLEPKRQRELTRLMLLRRLELLSTHQPLLCVFEDIHWMDPSSKELLDLMVDRIVDLPILVVATFRPELVPPWSGEAHMSLVAMVRLDVRNAEALAQSVAAGKKLPEELLRQIVTKTDGVPLFIEELTKAMLESALLKETNDAYELAGNLPTVAIPDTLQDSLMARLDRLGTTKAVAQLAATMGRTFSHRLLSVILMPAEAELDDALLELEQAGLIHRLGRSLEQTYEFKHGLVRDVAYQSLLREVRHDYHRRVANALANHFPEFSSNQPDVLAHHYTEGDLPEQAIEYWRRAGERASKRANEDEAVAHIRNGLRLVERLPNEEARDAQELALRIALGPALMNTEGSGSEVARNNYTRACELCQRAGQPEQHFAALWGLWFNDHTARRYKEARRLAEKVVLLAKSLADSTFQLQGHHAAWTTNATLGDLDKGLYHAECGLALYDKNQHYASGYIYGGHDAGVCGAADAALMRCLMGYPDTARKHLGTALSLADQLSRPIGLAHAHCYAAIVSQLLGDLEALTEHAEKLVACSSEHMLVPWLSNGQVLRGWALSQIGKLQEGIDLMREAIDDRRRRGLKLRFPYLLALFADALASAGNYDEAMTVSRESLQVIDQTAEIRWKALCQTTNAMLLLSESDSNAFQAEAILLEAVACAKQQQARYLQLAAASRLAKLWVDGAKISEARGILAPLYQWFSEGFSTRELVRARALLEQLA